MNLTELLLQLDWQKRWWLSDGLEGKKLAEEVLIQTLAGVFQTQSSTFLQLLGC